MQHLNLHNQQQANPPPEEILQIITSELRLIRKGIWYSSLVPFTIGFYGSVVFLSIKGAMEDWMTMILLIIPALFHYAPEHTANIVNSITKILTLRLGTSSELPRSEDNQKESE